MINRRTTAVALTALTLLLAGCSGTADSDEPDEPGGGWTVLHYSMADTNLEPFMVADVNEIGEVGSTGSLQVREFMDRSAEYGDDELLDQGSWVGARVLDIDPGSAELVEDLGDVNSADPTVLASFVAEGIAAHPAGHYALIISDHGASWPGVGPDEGSEGDVLDLAQIVEGVSAGLEEAGVDKLDLLGFDACLMGSYEVASAVAPLADRLVASQELEPGHGWDYRALQVLADDERATADDFGSAIVDGFEAQAAESGTGDSITLSMIDLTRMDAVDEALGEFSGALAERVATVAPAVGRAGESTLGFARSPNPDEDSQMKDLGMLASTIGVEALDVSDQADNLVRAINDAVVDSVAGQATNGATGLSIYFPPTQELSDGAYTEVASAATWTDFLISYYDAGTSIPEEEQPEFVDDGSGAEIEYDGEGYSITGVYDEVGEGNLTGASMSYALVGEDGTLTYLGEQSAVIGEEGAPVASGYYDLTALTVSDGEDTSYAYLALGYQEGDEVISMDVPMAYYAPEDVDGETYQDVLLSLVLDAESGDIVSEQYYVYDEESGGYGELNADPAGIIVPETLDVAPDGTQEWTATSDTGLYADLENLTYDLEPLPSGSVVQLDLTVTDFGDNSTTISGTADVP
ncbi:clostripain-related cysteine peptidase [Nocardioides sp. W7]|uniref:clostripain-related cysteine peptidase n=1 Tax=Nocardioides sp. W7 TaxID=2931390 RepID=UPI001FCFDC69|nr:clostripain-related cysteine peptidase [Nocardioides sp. W7]